FNQLDRFIGEAVGEVLARRPVRKRRTLVRTEIAMPRRAPSAAADIDVKSMPVGPAHAIAEMPLAHVPRLVSAAPQGRGDADLTRRQRMEIRHVAQLSDAMPADPLRHADPRRILA